VDLNPHTFSHLYCELLTTTANWRNCKYVYNDIPVFAVFPLCKDWNKKHESGKTTCNMGLAQQNIE
jgi:hypothetical protein